VGFLSSHPVRQLRGPESSSEEAHAALAASPLFGTLEPDVLRRLVPRFRRVHVRAGATLFRHGDTGDALFVVVSGRLRAVLIDDAGTERSLGEIGHGETVGEMAVLTGEARMGSVIAVRDTELIRLDRVEFERLTTARPRLMLELTRVLITRYRDTLREPRVARFRTLAVLPAHTAVPARRIRC
jgi:NTE family protein